MAAYVATDTLLLGGIPTRAELSLDQFVSDAADEMDTVLGSVFETPVSRNSEGMPLSRHASLTLARINRYLATGRYILAVASSGEDNGLHAYGARLVKEAMDALSAIAKKKVDFDAYEVNDSRDVYEAPAMLNAEAQSNVDAFYESYTGQGNMFFTGFSPI